MDFALLISSSLVQNPNAPPSVILTDANTSIGRRGSVRMDTTKTHEISKKHATIRYQQINNRYDWIVEDNKSLNGTFLNCKKVKKHVIKNGDELVFGGGSCFLYGDQITSTDNAECRYIFVEPEPKTTYSLTSNKSIVLNSAEECEDCCICYNPMTMQTKLSCGHSFCRRCLSKWGKQCERKEQPFVCPICRHEYNPSQAKIPSISLDNNEFLIQDIEPFLRKLDVLSVKEVEKVSIFNKWSADDKETFWRYYNIIAHSLKKSRIFRKVTNSSYWDIKDADNEQLRNALENLEGDLQTNNLREEVMMKVAYSIYHLEYVKPPERRTVR
ncbi:FHA domain containing protein [Tritrichomonas foetus]|uniref:E3 ubiquitin-protein ligase CHFR n=1 Tax=Tritrichomonas foetus TaxID=1144522 RepID=A0A1J4KYF5_9EUKA|nr:FHA domain containing protein [Tritrichomonas foetus]|eukprot:OHT14740.1 FHA domain containing protein [Tritrichomonas foetus]